MIKFFKKNPYLLMAYVALISISIGIGFSNGVLDGLIFFGITGIVSAWLLVMSFLV
ncbi:hypothetical protein LCGC14_1765940 [marine sediment metagenome]|uniref:Uncharacterized protein n=1 Tax=marine sediment metagenome TaxID=412755 RepID=A0A0F9GZP2_9ZZZZ